MSALGPKARAVVEAGRAGDEPTDRDRARVRAALMTAIAAGGAGAASVVGEGVAAGAVKGAVAVGWGWKALLVGLAVAGTVGAGVAVTLYGGPASNPKPRVLAEPSDALRMPAPPSAAPATSIPIPAPLPPRAPEAAPSSRVAAPSPGGAHAPAPAAPAPSHGTAPSAGVEPAASASRPADMLVAETRALGEAHGALQDGDPARALKLLDEQSAAYADGQLRQERTAARVLALCKLGRKDEARALAARFLADNPHSFVADRVRGACPSEGPR